MEITQNSKANFNGITADKLLEIMKAPGGVKINIFGSEKKPGFIRAVKSDVIKELESPELDGRPVYYTGLFFDKDGNREVYIKSWDVVPN
jgi:hypothetical protein